MTTKLWQTTPTYIPKDNVKASSKAKQSCRLPTLKSYLHNDANKNNNDETDDDYDDDEYCGPMFPGDNKINAFYLCRS